MESKSLCLRDDFRFFTPLCYVQNDRMSTLPNFYQAFLDEDSVGEGIQDAKELIRTLEVPNTDT